MARLLYNQISMSLKEKLANISNKTKLILVISTLSILLLTTGTIIKLNATKNEPNSTTKTESKREEQRPENSEKVESPSGETSENSKAKDPQIEPSADNTSPTEAVKAPSSPTPTKPETSPLIAYGVFLGLNENESSKLNAYKTVVIEPSEFSAKRISELKAAGKKVYGYLNIGAVENYRPYYSRFEDVFLGTYEDWPDEKWVNVATGKWQSFIIDELGKKYSNLGLDGFFLNNADVYYEFPRDDIYQGLVNILQGLRKYKRTLIINGGDTFVSKAISAGTAKSLLDGVNQETVFTSINFDNGTFGTQPASETNYFKNYLAKVKAQGLAVYLLEYGANQNLTKTIDSYCASNGFIWYNAQSLDLR